MRSEGDRYRPIVTVLKEKGGSPEKVLITSKEYGLVDEHEKMKIDYINASRKIRRQRIDLDKAYGKIEQLKKENKELRIYRDTYFSLKKAGVDLPHV